ncbi:MAG: lasso peptide biosynthesis B2 protein [Solirubrobacterales bacterium]
MAAPTKPAPAVGSPIQPRRLSLGAKARLAFEILTTYARARRAIREQALREALDSLRRPATRTPNRDDAVTTYVEALRLGSALTRTLRPLPLDDRCLTRSLVLTALLARRGVASRLVIGVSPGEEFGAHAWVELGGRPLLDPGDGSYERLVEL